MKRTSGLALQIMLCLLPLLAHAQVSWQKVAGPNEFVRGVTTTTNNDVYLGTGTYGVFKSSDGGGVWNNISAGLPDSSIRGVFASTTNEIFAGTGSHGIYKYNGSWTQINTGIPAGNIFVNGFAKGNAGVMYAALSTGKVYQWNGATWANINFNLTTTGLSCITVSPAGVLYVGDYGTGVYKFNGTNSWSLLGTGLPNANVVKLAVSTTDIVYAASDDIVCMVPAAGGAWSQVTTGLPALPITTMGMDAQDNLFVGNYTTSGTGNYTGYIYKSANGGNSWSLVSAALSTTAFWSFGFTGSGSMFAGASGIYKSANSGDSWSDINPGLDARKSIICYKNTSSGTMFVGTATAGVWRSTDGGITWQQKNEGLTLLDAWQINTDAAGDIFYLGYSGGAGIFRSTDNGDNWDLVSSNGTDFYTCLKQHNADTIWASSRFSGPTSLSYSTDNGQTWQNNVLDISAVWDIQLTSGSTMFVGSESEGVSRSTDGGHTWTLGVGNSIPWYGNVLALARDASGYQFAAGDWYQHNVWFSTPGSNGDVWTEFTDPDLDGVILIWDMVFDAGNNVYVATKHGVFMAQNSVWTAGTNWVPSSTGLPGTPQVQGFGFDNAGYMYAACFTNNGHNAGLYRTTVPVGVLPVELSSFSGKYNAAANANDLQWTTATEARNKQFELLKSTDGNRFFSIATLAGAGNASTTKTYDYADENPVPGKNYYKLKMVDFDGKETYSSMISIENAAKTAGLKIYPNPSNGVFQLEINSPDGRPVGGEMRIFNVLGAEVFRAGIADARTEIRLKVPGGVYFYEWRGNGEKSLSGEIFVK